MTNWATAAATVPTMCIHCCREHGIYVHARRSQLANTILGITLAPCILPAAPTVYTRTPSPLTPRAHRTVWGHHFPHCALAVPSFYLVRTPSPPLRLAYPLCRSITVCLQRQLLASPPHPLHHFDSPVRCVEPSLRVSSALFCHFPRTFNPPS